MVSGDAKACRLLPEMHRDVSYVPTSRHKASSLMRAPLPSPPVTLLTSHPPPYALAGRRALRIRALLDDSCND